MLYYTDQKDPKFKKYRIPATENPGYRYHMYKTDLMQFGGENADDFQRLVLGKHGDIARTIIPRESMLVESTNFISNRFSQINEQKGDDYKQVFNINRVTQKPVYSMFACDCGYTDPTIIQYMIMDERGIWRTHARYRLTRIAFPVQAEIIDWLDSIYKPDVISLDLGAGGGGIGISQDLQSGRFSSAKRYEKRVTGVRFSDFIDTHEMHNDKPLKIMAKSFAGEELARMIADKQLVFSEIDGESMSQLSRVAGQRRPDGTMQYYVQDERGLGKSSDDHIFAAYIVFVLTLLQSKFGRQRRKLTSSAWVQ